MLDVGPEISAPDGDPYEAYRILFVLAFFFFVIVISLARPLAEKVYNRDRSFDHTVGNRLP